MKIPETILKILYPSYYRSWRLRKKDSDMKDFEIGMLKYLPRGTVDVFASGKDRQGVIRHAIYRLNTWLPFLESNEIYQEPEKSEWTCLGFVDEKPFKETTFREYLDMR